MADKISQEKFLGVLGLLTQTVNLIMIKDDFFDSDESNDCPEATN